MMCSQKSFCQHHEAFFNVEPCMCMNFVLILGFNKTHCAYAFEKSLVNTYSLAFGILCLYYVSKSCHFEFMQKYLMMIMDEGGEEPLAAIKSAH